MIEFVFDMRLLSGLVSRISNPTIQGRVYQELAQEQIFFLGFLCLRKLQKLGHER